FGLVHRRRRGIGDAAGRHRGARRKGGSAAKRLIGGERADRAASRVHLHHRGELLLLRLDGLATAVGAAAQQKKQHGHGGENARRQSRNMHRSVHLATPWRVLPERPRQRAEVWPGKASRAAPLSPLRRCSPPSSGDGGELQNEVLTEKSNRKRSVAQSFP